MPAPKKRPQAVGAKYASKKAKTSVSKSTTKSKGYGGKAIDWEAAVRLADAAANKAINKNIETQVSRAKFLSTFNQAITSVSGMNLRNMNITWTAPAPNQPAQPLYIKDGAIAFNLGFLSQHGSQLAGGFRVGQKINAKYLRVLIEGNIPQNSADCVYHFRIVRRRADQSQQLAYHVPTVTTMNNLRLFKTDFDGPFASEVKYAEGADSANPFPACSSAGRQNTDEWRFMGGDAYKTKFVKGVPLNTSSGTDYHTSHFVESVYHKVEEEWDFPARPPNSELKGGNYFFVMWREGPPDPIQMLSNFDKMEALGGLQFSIMAELSFKDGG